MFNSAGHILIQKHTHMWFLVPQTVAPKTHNCKDWLDVSIRFPSTGIKGPKHVQNMSDLHRALTSTPPYPNFLTLHEYLTSLMLVWLIEHTSPYSHAPKSNRKSSQKRESDYNIKRGQAQLGVIVKCLQVSTKVKVGWFGWQKSRAKSFSTHVQL